MKKKHIKLLKFILPIALGVFLIGYSYSITSAEDRTQILKYIKEADYFWVSISLIFGILSHLSRAIRWRYMLNPIGYSPKLNNTFLIVLMSYFANLGIPRSGEILRATALTTYEDVPFEKGFGTIVAERVIDMIMLLLLIATAFFLQTDSIIAIMSEKGFSTKSIVIIVTIGIAALLFFFFFIKKSTQPFVLKIKNFILGLLEGVTSIFKMPNKWAFLFHTLFIWFCYIAMFWVIKLSIPETENLDTSVLLVAFIAGAFAMSATNGGLGLFPIAVSQILVLYGVSKVSADAYGWIMWISQTLMVIVLGGISFLLIPILNRNK